jgi:hypothetical protein
MDINRLAGILILICIFSMGCSGPYGKIRKQTGNEDLMTLAELKENWEEYTIYYSYRRDSSPSAIMFDPKNDDNKLVGDSWHKIEDQEIFSEAISKIQQRYDYATVEIIEGPDNQFFGYMYYPSYLYVPVKVVDERTLYVMTLPPPKSTP